MPVNITTFIFDCFGVVCSPVLNSWYQDHHEKHGFTDEHLMDVFRKFDLNIFSEEDIIDHFSKYEGVTSTKEQLRNEIDDYLEIDESLVELIKKLKQKGFKVALLSNANNSFFERKIYIKYPEFKNLFSEIVISSVVGMIKPDPEIYLHTLNLVRSEAEESLFIDDSKLNVDAAIALGINGFMYTDCTSFVDYLSTIKIDLDS